jgi:hypothetical protein
MKCASDDNLPISCDSYMHTFRTLLQGSHDKGQFVNLELHVLDPFPENTMFKFCELHEICKVNVCGLIAEELKQDNIFMDCRKKMIDADEESLDKFYTNNESILSTCNLTRLISTKRFLNVDESSVSVFNTLAVDINALKSQDERPRRYCFIHSSPSTNVEDGRSLESILMKLHVSGLGVMLERLWVLNYGEPLPTSLSMFFPWARFIEIGSNRNVIYPHITATLSLVYAFSKELNAVRRGDDQVLFLNTADQLSYYDSLNKNFKESRNMHIYSILERHDTCYHLLSSGYFDVVGSYYTSFPPRFVGNNFWASTRYISHLRAPDNNASSRLQTESWILSGYRPRVYIMHTSYSDMSQYLYPNTKYIPKENIDVLRHNESNFNFNCTSLLVIN